MNLNFYLKLAKKELFTLCRSLTGEGNLQTLKILKKYEKKLVIKKFTSGKKVFDWKIPKEWVIKKAEVSDKFGNKIINFKDKNLKVIGYSQPKKKIISKDELLKKIFTLPNQPNAIPYITSYYKKRWGFCITHNDKKLIQKRYKKNDKFKICIESKFKKEN